jgi:ABC-type spermidine/putrescine transport system permease subunit I
MIIFVAITVKDHFDKYTNDKNEIIMRTMTVKSILATLISTFITIMIAYMLMYVLFGYGGGMEVNSE